MAYHSGSAYFVRFAASTASISNSTGAITGAPTIGGGSTFDVGYTGVNGVTIDDGTRQGWAAGRRGASYAARGYRTVAITFNIRIGSGEFLSTYCLPAGVPPKIDIFYGVSGSWARAIYQARCSRVSIQFPLSDGGEITASVTFEGIAYQNVTGITLDYSYEQFGAALLATDARVITVGGSDFRQNLMNFTLDVEHSIERKNGRPEFGHNVPGSRTAYDIIAHHRQVTYGLTLHDLPVVESELFYADVLSMDWGALIIGASDVAATKSFQLTLANPRPVSRTQNEIESGAQMNWTVQGIADDVVCEAVDTDE